MNDPLTAEEMPKHHSFASAVFNALSDVPEDEYPEAFVAMIESMEQFFMGQVASCGRRMKTAERVLDVLKRSKSE